MSDVRTLRADARRNRERLIEAAQQAFGEHGVGASMDEIARRARVGPGTLYRHFPTKEALLLAVYRTDVEQIAQRATILSAELPPWEALAAWLREQLDYISHRHGVGAAIKTMLGTQTEVLDICRQLMRSAIGGLIERAQQAGVVRADADPVTVLRLAHAVGVASETDPSFAEPMLAIVLRGLEPPHTSS